MKLSRRGKSARRGRHTKRAGKHLRYKGKKVRASKRYHRAHKRTYRRGRKLQRGGVKCGGIEITEWHIDTTSDIYYKGSHVAHISMVTLRNKKTSSYFLFNNDSFQVVLRILRDKTLRIQFIRIGRDEEYFIRDLNMFEAPQSSEWQGTQLRNETVKTEKCSFNFRKNDEIFKCIREAIEERLPKIIATSNVYESFDMYPE